MKETKIKIAFIISRLSEVLIIYAAVLIFFVSSYYHPWAISFIIASLFSMVWGGLGILGFFDESVVGNVVCLILLVFNFVIFMICLINGLIFFNLKILIASVLAMAGSGISFYCNIIINASI
jgi:hypothetical protein